MRHIQLHDYPAPSRARLVGKPFDDSSPVGDLAVAGLPAPDRDAAPFEAWLAVDRAIGDLQARWARHEAILMDLGGWRGLDAEEQERHPGAAHLHALEARTSQLREIWERDLPDLVERPALSRRALSAKLAVAERLVAPEDYPEANELIAGAREDLAALP